MNKILNKKSLCVFFSLAVTACAAPQTLRRESILNVDTCAVTQLTTLTEGEGKAEKLLELDDRYIKIDDKCIKTGTEKQRAFNKHQEKMAQLDSAAQLLTVTFTSILDPVEKSEILNRILSNLASSDVDWRNAQEKALAKRNLTQDDIIRAEAIDLIGKIKSANKETRSTATAELLRIYNGEKYPNRLFIPKQIIDRELIQIGQSIEPIKQAFAEENARSLTVCKMKFDEKKLRGMSCK